MTTKQFWLSCSLLSLGVFTLKSQIRLFYIIFVIGHDDVISFDNNDIKLLNVSIFLFKKDFYFEFSTTS